MIPSGVQSSRVIIEGVARHYKGAIMGMKHRADAEGPGLSKEKGYVTHSLDIGITRDMMLVVVVEGIFKGIEIDSGADYDENNKYAKSFHSYFRLLSTAYCLNAASPSFAFM